MPLILMPRKFFKGTCGGICLPIAGETKNPAVPQTRDASFSRLNSRVPADPAVMEAAELRPAIQLEEGHLRL